MNITDITVNSTAVFVLFALFNTVPFASAVVGSQVNRSPLFRYVNAFVRCDGSASRPYVNMVAKSE